MTRPAVPETVAKPIAWRGLKRKWDQYNYDHLSYTYSLASFEGRTQRGAGSAMRPLPSGGQEVPQPPESCQPEGKASNANSIVAHAYVPLNYLAKVPPIGLPPHPGWKILRLPLLLITWLITWHISSWVLSLWKSLTGYVPSSIQPSQNNL